MSGRPVVTFNLSDEDMTTGVMGLLEVLDMLGVADVRGMEVETGAWVVLKCPDLDTAEAVAANLKSWHLNPVVSRGTGTP
jgi:hypothetical protein